MGAPIHLCVPAASILQPPLHRPHCPHRPPLNKSFTPLPITTQNNSLRALKRIPRLQNLPRPHGTWFHAQHVFIPLLRLKVRHSFSLFDPRVPDDDVTQIIAEHSELGLVVVSRQDGHGNRGGRVAAGRGIDAVGFGGDGEQRSGLGVVGGDGGGGFVGVGGGLEAGEGGGGDVLGKGGVSGILKTR